MGMEIELTRAAIERLATAAKEALPNEACGLLLGLGSRIERVREVANVHPEPVTHFEIDPKELIAAHRAARHGGPEVVGYFHSHPDGLPEPSPTDLSHATGDGRVWAIVSKGDIAFWRDDGDGFAKLSYIVDDS